MKTFEYICNLENLILKTTISIFVVLGWARCLIDGGQKLNILSGGHMPALRHHISEEIKDAKITPLDEIFVRKRAVVLKRTLRLHTSTTPTQPTPPQNDQN